MKTENWCQLLDQSKLLSHNPEISSLYLRKLMSAARWEQVIKSTPDMISVLCFCEVSRKWDDIWLFLLQFLDTFFGFKNKKKTNNFSKSFFSNSKTFKINITKYFLLLLKSNFSKLFYRPNFKDTSTRMWSKRLINVVQPQQLYMLMCKRLKP